MVRVVNALDVIIITTDKYCFDCEPSCQVAHAYEGQCSANVQLCISSALEIVHPIDQSPLSSTNTMLETTERIAILAFVNNHQTYVKIFLL